MRCFIFSFPGKKRKKYEIGEIRTHDIYFVGYIALPNGPGSH